MALRILHAVEFYPPSVGGAQEVVRQVSRRLAERGHDVTVATTALAERRSDEIDGVKVAEFAVRGNAVRGLEGDVGAYRRFVRDGGFDVVMTYAAQQWTTDALLDVLDDIPARTVLAPCGFSGLRQRAYAGYFDGLRHKLGDFDALVFHSDTYQDISFARAAGAGNLVVIPNAADEREFGTRRDRGAFRTAIGVAETDPLLLTVGGHTGYKGHAESISALQRSRRARNGTLAIVGNQPIGPGCSRSCRIRATMTPLLRPGRSVVLTDPPRETVLEAFAAADLFVFCSKIECSPLVLFEAMAAGLPFVTLDVGNSAEIVAWSEAGVCVPSRRDRRGVVTADGREVAKAVDELLGNAELRRRLGENGRRAWAERFTWDAVASRYERLYEQLAA